MTTIETRVPVSDDAQADRELKARHRALWASGDYAAVATTVIPHLGAVVVDALGIRPDDHVLDLAAGSGNAALPAARLGARVVASDLTPELLAAGRAAAAREGLELDWQEADAERLPYADASFDIVMSCVGVMFAPHHEAVAAELLRVTRPGGRIGLIAWTPEGFVGRMLGVMKPYAAPPPPGGQPPILWGRPEHNEMLLGDGVTDLRVERRTVTVDAFIGGAELRDFFKANYGPTVMTYRRNADNTEAVAALDEGLAGLGDQALAGGSSMEWEYLLVTATRR
jgi:SAM-dependent methyltransferase